MSGLRLDQRCGFSPARMPGVYRIKSSKTIMPPGKAVRDKIAIPLDKANDDA